VWENAHHSNVKPDDVLLQSLNTASPIHHPTIYIEVQLLHVCRTSLDNNFPADLILLDLLVLVIQSAHPGDLAV
jgi:hypothetical protein